MPRRFRLRSTSFAAAAFALALAAGAVTPPAAQAPAPASAGPVEPALIEDLVAASRILAAEGVLDGLGHVSVRHPGNPQRYLMARSIAPALVTAGDIMEYDLDSVPVDPRGRTMFRERFIHGEVYKARPDVGAVIHSHSPTVIPFGISTVPMRPVFHTGSFLSPSVPVFEIRDAGGMTDMTVVDAKLGKALAASLGKSAVVLMRGHGNVVVADGVPLAVFRAVYTEVNARLQLQAIQLGGPLNFIAPEEAAKVNARTTSTADNVRRVWALWKLKAMPK
jgi:HCOMODA/2-hydroxy-3-carboxy-muconic semialdehyde decarboxylase